MLNKKAKSNSRRGFTLIELLIIIAIVAVLLSVILVTLSVARTRAKDNSFKTTAHSIQTALTSCCITPTTLNTPSAGGQICSAGPEKYLGAESMGGGSVVSSGCNSGNFIVTINTGTKNSGTYASATIRSDSITFNE